MSVSDFWQYFYPATRAWLAGGNPYALEGVYNPPWAWWLLGPLAGWGPQRGWWAWAILTLGATLLALLLIRRPRPGALLLLLLAPATLVHLAMGQWALWGLLGVALLQGRRPALQGAGLFLLSLKPHLGWPFLALAAPQAWAIPAGAVALSLLQQPRWPLDFLASLLAEPPVGYRRLIVARSLALGAPFLLALALLAALLALWAIWRYRPARPWRLALLCCATLFLTPYHRLYDNVILFYPILLLTERQPWAWLLAVALVWMPLLLVVWPWAVFVDWLAPLVLLLALVGELRRGAAAVRPLGPTVRGAA